MNQKNPIKTTAIAIGTAIVIIAVISVLALNGVFHGNPYGPEQKINNFSRYFKDVPASTRDMIYTGLYNIVSLNLEDQAPYPKDIDATIRDNSTNREFNENTNIHTDSFIVDVNQINQSFNIRFEWSANENNPDLSGYQLSITCTPQEDSLFDSSTCRDSSSISNPIEDLYQENPFLSQLPLDVSFYTDQYSGFVHYSLTYELTPDLNDENQQNLTIIITDYTGGNQERALTKLKSLGADPSKYNVQYVNDSADYTPGRVPESDIVDV